MKILRKYYILIVTFCALFFSSTKCDADHYFGEFFSVENCDNDTIFVMTFNGESLKLSSEYVFSHELKLTPIPPGSKYSEFKLGPYNRLHPEEYVDEQNQIIIFRKRTLEKYSKKDLCEKNIYDALYILARQEIIDMESNVKFPMDQEVL